MASAAILATKRQVYLCEGCHAISSVEHKKRASSLEVLDLIKEDHSKNTHCLGGFSEIRVVNKTLSTEDLKKLPVWAVHRVVDLIRQ